MKLAPQIVKAFAVIVVILGVLLIFKGNELSIVNSFLAWAGRIIGLTDMFQF